MTSEEEMMKMVVNEAWDQYDPDNTGRIDKDKTRKFLEDKLQAFGVETLNDDTFEATFKQYDLEGIGTINKDNFIDLLGKCAGDQE